MAWLKLALGALFVSCLSSCSGTYHAYADMLKMGFAEGKDIALTYGEITDTRYDLIYVGINDRPRVTMALMFIEQGQLKWISSDSAMLITENGRIIRTLGMKNDLLSLTNIDADPVKNLSAVNKLSSWIRLADWQQGEFGYELQSGFRVIPNQTLSYFGHSFNVTKVIESVNYAVEPNFVRLDNSWQNVYWYDADTKLLLKTVQQLSPFSEQYELTFITQIVRQLSDAGVNVAADAI